jgi:hypothetical protein
MSVLKRTSVFNFKVAVVQTDGGVIVICEHVETDWRLMEEDVPPAKMWGDGTALKLWCCDNCALGFQVIIEAVELRYKRPDVD